MFDDYTISNGSPPQKYKRGDFIELDIKKYLITVDSNNDTRFFPTPYPRAIILRIGWFFNSDSRFFDKKLKSWACEVLYGTQKTFFQYLDDKDVGNIYNNFIKVDFKKDDKFIEADIAPEIKGTILLV